PGAARTGGDRRAAGVARGSLQPARRTRARSARRARPRLGADGARQGIRAAAARAGIARRGAIVAPGGDPRRRGPRTGGGGTAGPPGSEAAPAAASIAQRGRCGAHRLPPARRRAARVLRPVAGGAARSYGSGRIANVAADPTRLASCEPVNAKNSVDRPPLPNLSCAESEGFGNRTLEPENDSYEEEDPTVHPCIRPGRRLRLRQRVRRLDPRRARPVDRAGR